MTSTQPYLLRAFYDWIVDNDMTPYVVVNTEWPGVEVPTQYVKDGQIVLNVSPTACINFLLNNDAISFQARFGGQPMQVFFPCGAVNAIYAKENGAGTVFTEELPKQDASNESKEEQGQTPPPSPRKSGRASLKVIK
ncbi:MAG: ClpXP protease specificity-enhancing factor [Pseudomonadota bacterium]